MKITFLCATVSLGGGSRVTATHARNLLQFGHDVNVISRAPAKPSLKNRVGRLVRNEGPAIPPDRTLYFDPLGDRHRQIPPGHELQPEDLPDADILIATWWETAFDAMRMPPEKGQKVYFVQHHEVHDHLPKERSALTYDMPFKKIAVSQWLVDVMASEYGDTNVSKVLNAVDHDLFDAPARGRQERPTVGMMYSDVPFKGAAVAIEAIERLRDRYSDLRLLVFGKSDPTRDLPLPAFAEFHRSPAQPDIAKLYAACDAWIVPSFDEGYGLPIIEAMACRTPVVSTTVGAARDLVQPGHNGFIVEPGDSTAMADRLADILALSDEEWQRFSDAAHRTAHGYSWLDASRQFEAVLKDVMTRSGDNLHEIAS